MPDGYHLRPLPDGCFEFVLAAPTLTSIVIAQRTTLRFGPVDVVLPEPCLLEIDGAEHLVDQSRPVTLWPLLTLSLGVARWVVAAPDGGLTVTFVRGQRLTGPGPAVRRGWTVGVAASAGR